MDIGTIIKNRRSIRKFADKKVPRQVLEEILNDALWAPSGMNRQNWDILVVHGEQKEKLIQVIAGAWPYARPGLEAVLPAKIVNLTKQFFKTLGGAPVVILVYISKTFVDRNEDSGETKRLEASHDRLTAFLSAAALIQNILLLAYSRGLGACWMTAPKYVETGINELFDIKEKELVAAIPIGYPGQNPPAPPRKPDKIRWVGFD